MSTPPAKTRILVLGGGFGGLYASLHLERMLGNDPAVELTLVSEQNFILFTPMLHEVAASDLDMSNIINPIRKMLRKTNFIEAIVDEIDLAKKTVKIGFGLPRRHKELSYDKLLIAVGSETKYFDSPGVRENAVTMKTLGDAVFLRNKMIGMFETASIETDEAMRKSMLTFVVAGGGFAGVETVGGMNDFLRETVEKYYPALRSTGVRVVLIHPGKVVLPEFSEKLGEYTGNKLRENGIDVRLSTKVTGYVDSKVRLDPGEEIDAQTLVWTTGVTPPQFIANLDVPKTNGRINVNACMELDAYAGVWVVGDCAAIPDPATGKPYPATAQHAIRQGKVVGKNICFALRGVPQRPFTYKMLGQLAAIGRRTGVANIFGINFSGFIAWFMWRTIYLSKLPRLEKKVRVALDWTLDLFFSKDIVQFITLRQAEQINRPGIPHAHPDADQK